MPELIHHAPDNRDFARVIELRQLRDRQRFEFDIAPNEAEAAAIARLMGARAVRKLRLRGQLAPRPDGGWRLDAALGATVVQTCVVTLDPVTTRIDQPVGRSYLPGAAARGPEVVLDPEADDEVEPLAERIDLGLLAIEALALALPAFPRRPGAVFEPTAVSEGDADERGSRPFAGLAALRGKLGSRP